MAGPILNQAYLEQVGVMHKFVLFTFSPHFVCMPANFRTKPNNQLQWLYDLVPHYMSGKQHLSIIQKNRKCGLVFTVKLQQISTRYFVTSYLSILAMPASTVMFLWYSHAHTQIDHFNSHLSAKPVLASRPIDCHSPLVTKLCILFLITLNPVNIILTCSNRLNLTFLSTVFVCIWQNFYKQLNCFSINYYLK